jgi:hypothetical protein
MKSIFLSGAFLALPFAVALGQCPFDPVVNGELLVCPDGFTTLSTQQYDAYQWYSRPFSGGTAQPIAGATGATLDVDYDQTPVYISVEATLNGCTERSPEVLVDGRVFLPVVVRSEGNFTVGNNGEMEICPGDTAYLILLLPYTINIQWYDGLEAVPGATDDTLVVTQPGSYWVEASPGECPEYLQFLGVWIEVVNRPPGECTSAAPVPEQQMAVRVFPNPAGATLRVALEEDVPASLVLLDALGRPLRQQIFRRSTVLFTAGLPAGCYWLQIRSGHIMSTERVLLTGY